MAHKPKSYYIKPTKILVLFDNVEPTEAEQKMIDRFIEQGYEVRFETKKPSKTIDEMRAELASDKEALAKFEDIYSGKEEVFKKDGTKETAFFAACRYYGDWSKAKKKKK